MTRPLIVSDCDGVLLDFVDPFIAYLAAEHELTLELKSFALAGNIRRADGSAVETGAFRGLLDGFFDTHMATQTDVPGAAEALAALAETCDVVVLTNIAEAHAVMRTGELARRGMPYRVIGNNGPKGGPLKALIDYYAAQLFGLHRRSPAAHDVGERGRSGSLPAAHGRRTRTANADSGVPRCRYAHR